MGGESALVTALTGSWSFESDATSDVDGGQAWTESGGTPAYISGHVGNCTEVLAFTEGDVLSIANASAGVLQPGTGTLSFSVWLYIVSFPGTTNTILYFGGNTNAIPGWTLVYRSSGPIVRFYISQGTLRISFDSATFPGTGTWFHLMGEMNRADDTARMWINNGTATTLDISSHTSFTSAQDAKLGSGYLTAADLRIDQLMIFNEPLNSDRRSFLYNSGSGRTYADLANYSGD